MAPGKKRLRMKGVKQTPKRLEEEILERSRRLAEDPGLLRPMCAGNCRKCAFDKTFKVIDSVSGCKEDADKLIKMASRGSDDLVKAYAGTISLNAAGKIPMLATATLAGEKVPFAVRGAVGNDKLIGCQYYNDPKLRLLYYNGFIKKNKLHLYSFEEGLVCSDDPHMPEDYLYESFWETPYEFKDDGLTCGHDGALALNIRIKSIDETIHICEDCAKDVSTIQFLIAKICAADPLDDFEVTVSHKYHSANESGTEKIEGDELKRYLRGEINDSSLLQSLKRIKLGDLKHAESATYIVGSQNYGSNLDMFIKSITGSEIEKNTLLKFLSAVPRSVVIRNGKASEAFTALWDNDWKEIIAACTSKEIADSFTERPRTLPIRVLEEAYQKHISADVVASLPEFKKPKPITKLSDHLAKAAKVNGYELVIKVLETETMKSSKERCVSAAFILACNPDAKIQLHLSKEDRDFADFLMPFAKAVIDANGEQYKNAMNTLLTACSSGESV